MGDVIDMRERSRDMLRLAEERKNQRIEQAVLERKTRHPRYMALLDAAIERARKGAR